jgi:hypothetical protein
MGVSEYDEHIITSYNKYLLNYLDNSKNLNGISKNTEKKIIIQGFQTLLHVLSILYSINMKEDQINSYLEKCPLLFIEYTEQVYLKKTDIIHTPSMFVYNVLLGTITLQDHKCKRNNFMNNFIKWSHSILFWDCQTMTLQNRIYFVRNFMQPYLMLFTKLSLSKLSVIFENIQNKLLHKSNVYELYLFLLTSFLNFFTKKKCNYSDKEIKQICFDKFMSENDYINEQLDKVSTLKHMDAILKWVFM